MDELFNVGDFYNFFNREMDVHVHHNYVYDPDILSPAVLPKEMRERIHKKFSNIFPSWKLTEFEKMFRDLIEKINGKRLLSILTT